MGGGGIGKCSKIRHIVHLRQMLRRWRTRAAFSSKGSSTPPSDVPAGYVAVCVATTTRRFVVRAAHLNHPVFRKLLAQAEEEYGFTHSGPITVPCDESAFEDVLSHITSSNSTSTSSSSSSLCCCSCCHLARRGANWHSESLPLLGTDKSVW